jgi:uncharacterized iron-regulated protein
MKYLVSAIVFLVSTVVFGQKELQTFQFYENGKQITFYDAIASMSKSDVVLFGELHDHAMVHWLQLKTAQELAKKNRLIFGAEFFETDDQLLLDEVVDGTISIKKFEDEAKLWPNYETDYKPILQLAIDSGIVFIATNIPRRYASIVARQGLDTLSSLSPKALELLPPFPMPFSMETPGYQEVYDMMGGGHGMSPENFVKAQAIKDYTMAYNIGENLEKKSLFLHFNGDFHSKDFGGIYWYMSELYPKQKVKTIKVIQVNDFDSISEEDCTGGDIILFVPEDFSKSY